jgi:hypothetical protein
VCGKYDPATLTSKYSTISHVTVTIASSPKPTVTSSWSPSSITTVGSSLYSYSSTGATKCKVTHPDGTGTWDPASTSFSQNYGGLTENVTTTVVCYSADGTASEPTTAVVAVTPVKSPAVTCYPAQDDLCMVNGILTVGTNLKPITGGYSWDCSLSVHCLTPGSHTSLI